MKFIHRENYKNYIIGLVTLILSGIAFPLLPEQIPIHFNAQGIPDNYGSPLTIFLLPIIILSVNVLAEVTKHTDPQAANYFVFSKHYYQFFLALNLFLFLVQMYLITYALELVTFNVTGVVIVAIGVLFIIVGNMMPKVKQNFFMGIKTPWALADEQIWYATHRFGGKLWFVVGILLCICGFLPTTVQIPAIMIGAGIATAAPMVYSYVIYKRRSSK